jgi:transcription termination factor NusB
MSGTPRISLLRKRASRLAAVQAMYSEALIEKSTAPMLLANQLLQSWADSAAHDTGDLPGFQPEAALLNKLIDAAQKNREVIDAAILTLIQPGWKKSRMSLPLLSVLQVFAAEVIAAPARGAATLIEEYTEVGAELLTEEELSFAHKGFNLLLQQFRPISEA